MAYQNKNSELIAAMITHAGTARGENGELGKGVVPMDSEDLKRLCKLATEALKQNPLLDTEFFT